MVNFSVMELIRSGELLHKATQKRKAEKTKLKNYTRNKKFLHTIEILIVSFTYSYYIFLSLFFYDTYLLFDTLANQSTDETETEEEK